MAIDEAIGRPGRLPLTRGVDISEATWARARLAATVALLTGLAALTATIGADDRWLAALGRVVVAHRSVPDGIPFAAAPSGHWHNALVLAEVVLDLIQRAFGDRGLVLAQLIGVAGGLWLVGRDAVAGGARSVSACTTLMLIFVGAIASLVVVRVQLFSLILFPLLVLLLRGEARSPTRRIWWAPALLAVWANLHGAVLLGIGVLFAYLLARRAREDLRTAAAVALAALVAICLTPAGVGTIDYYKGLLSNVAAQRGVGLWAPIGHSPLDWVLVAVAVLLVIRARPWTWPLWESAVLLALTLLTVKAARDGVWLLFFLAGPAAARGRGGRDWNGLVPLAAVLGTVLLVLGLQRGPLVTGAGDANLARALTLARGTPILADAIPSEQLALAGARIWIGNPLDAFSSADQGAYLDWLAGAPGGRSELANPQIRVVLVSRGSAAQALTAAYPGFARAAGDSRTVLYVRRGAA